MRQGQEMTISALWRTHYINLIDRLTLEYFRGRHIIAYTKSMEQ
jgi:hypothetical protein